MQNRDLRHLVSVLSGHHLAVSEARDMLQKARRDLKHAEHKAIKALVDERAYEFLKVDYAKIAKALRYEEKVQQAEREAGWDRTP